MYNDDNDVDLPTTDDENDSEDENGRDDEVAGKASDSGARDGGGGVWFNKNSIRVP